MKMSVNDTGQAIKTRAAKLPKLSISFLRGQIVYYLESTIAFVLGCGWRNNDQQGAEAVLQRRSYKKVF